MIRSKKLTRVKNVKHGFFNSIGGQSKNIYKSLNCGPGSLDNKINVKKNLQIVKKKLAINQKISFYFIKSTVINSYLLIKSTILKTNQKLML